MKQRIKFIFIVFFTASCVFAQDIQQSYINMPEELSPLLSKGQRVEMLEYYKASLGDSITNRFGTQSYILSLDTTQQSILLKTTEISTFEMKLFEHKKKPIIAIIRTLCTPLCYSTISFYDQAWNSISINFQMPTAWDWVESAKLPRAKTEQKNIRNSISTSFISLSFSKEGNKIIAQNNSLDFLSEQDKKRLAPLFKQEKMLVELTGKKKEFLKK